MAKHKESKLQQACVKWFDLQYPKLRMNLFAIPNGGKRNKFEAAIMKGEGVRAGVSDMFLAVCRWRGNDLEYAGMFIEFKFGKGKLTDKQQEFKKAIDVSYQHEIIYDFDTFKNRIEYYLD